MRIDNKLNWWFYKIGFYDKIEVLDWINENLENFTSRSVEQIAEDDARSQGIARTEENIEYILCLYWDEESEENKQAGYDWYQKESDARWAAMDADADDEDSARFASLKEYWWDEQSNEERANILDWIQENCKSNTSYSREEYDKALKTVKEDGHPEKYVGETLDYYFWSDSAENQNKAYRHFTGKEQKETDEMPNQEAINESIKSVFSLMERMDRYTQNGNSSILL